MSRHLAFAGGGRVRARAKPTAYSLIRMVRFPPLGAEVAMRGGTAQCQLMESRSVRPATALTLRGAASQIAKAETVLQPAAIQNAGE
jgi:hypothetical protein